MLKLKSEIVPYVRPASRVLLAVTSLLILVIVATVPLLAIAAVVDPTSDPLGYVAGIYAAFKAGDYRMLVAMAMIGIVAAARKWGPSILKGDRGGAAVALVVGVVGSVATVIMGDASLSVMTIVDGLVAGVTAAGGYVVIKKLIWPSDAK